MTSYEAPWRKQLIKGSFRGVPFFVKTAQTQVGRRVVIHEYPQRDDAFPEDLGLKADAFSIEVIVIGPDYIKARNALIAALKERGPGLLKHPYYGERTVTLASPARISETPEEGGMARFSLDFIEAGQNVEPTARQDTQGAVESAADAANQAVADDFAKGYEVAGHPDFVEGSALALARDAMSALDAARRTLVPDLAVLSDYMAAANGVMGAVNSLIRAPAAYAQGVLGMVGALKALAKSPLHALNSYRGLLDYGSKHNPVAASTPSRARQAANQAALDALTRRGALVEASRVASRVTFDTYNAAVAARDDLAARLDDEAAGITPGGMQEVSEPVYRALTALRVALVRDLTARAIDAPRVTSATLPATMPALVAAYKIHGDAGLESEIISRNRGLVRHPGFVPGGEALEVLAR
ncbi:DNA circularization protein [Azonexus sp.]|uniref:DNA circularization protein n=1 Tax=Azonexus sp. TaxID=1872668 RepID=UPI0035B03BFE